jgi:hypothetical protein
MSKKNGVRSGLAEPSKLKLLDSNDKRMLRVIIETPKGSRNKFAFDSQRTHLRTEKGTACWTGFSL